MVKMFGKKKGKAKQGQLQLRPDAHPDDSAMYQYARQSYDQTIAPAFSNDDGHGVYQQQYADIDNDADTGIVEDATGIHDSSSSRHRHPVQIAQHTARRSTSVPIQEEPPLAPNPPTTAQFQPQPQPHCHSNDANAMPMKANTSNSQTRIPPNTFYANPPPPPTTTTTTTTTESTTNSNVTTQQQQYEQQQQQHQPPNMRYRRVPEPEMVDTTYEEQYGDAYIGARIKYVYPSGYQSMRPRGGPWKISIAIFLLFTWLSIFTVGHCYDRTNSYNYNNDDYENDAERVIATRWCGSRMLYFMWVTSMLITGLAAAYCSVIGYIKVRDFAVANCRSQPPGMVGKSDYYVKIVNQNEPSSVDEQQQQGSSLASYQHSIYQSDGTPQFWGGNIYRPTQAAVAVTSR